MLMNAKIVVAGVTAGLMLSGCAPTIWDRWETTAAQFSMDNARCRLMAEGANPDFGSPAVHTGSFKRDLAANAALGIVEGIAQGLAVRHTYELCMQANGYVARAPGAASPVSVAAAAGATVPPISAAAAAPTAAAPTPLPVVAAPPMEATPCGGENRPCSRQTTTVGVL